MWCNVKLLWDGTNMMTQCPGERGNNIQSQEKKKKFGAWDQKEAATIRAILRVMLGVMLCVISRYSLHR
jgi:hypothetical protein